MPDEIDIKQITKKYPGIDSPGTVGIHVRRGDYLMLSNVLPTMDKKYFIEAMKLLGEYEHAFIFTDDPKWVSETLQFEKTTIVKNNPDYFDLWALSLCNHNIISNSSFSWWGSFLNTHKDKKVYAPSQWFGPGWPPKEHMVHEEYWNIIDVRYINGSFYKTAPGC